MKNNSIVFIMCFLIIFTSLNAEAISWAPDNLVLEKGQYVKGNYTQYLNNSPDPDYIVEAEYTIKVEDIIELSDVSKDFILMSTNYEFISSNFENISEIAWIQKSLIWKHNRTIAIPIVEYEVINGSLSVKCSLLSYSTLNEMRDLNNSVITLSNGSTYLWSEIFADYDPFSFYIIEDELLAFLYWQVSFEWELHSNIPEKLNFAISPDSEVGDFVDYGWYNGSIVAETTILIGENNYPVYHCYIPDQTYIYGGSDSSFSSMSIIGGDYYYHKDTGLILKVLSNTTIMDIKISFIASEFNSKGDTGRTIRLNYEPIYAIGSLVLFSVILFLRRRKTYSF